MKATKICEGVYWVGAIDWDLRNFHGYETEKGSTYNAYLVLDEKITLIDTVKAGFEKEMLTRIASVIDPAKIDLIISNHAEPDHSGGIPAVKKLAPGAAVYCAAGAGVKDLTAYYGDLGYIGVKAGDTLSLGKRTLTFLPTPMVHWPDNMVSFMTPENILFSNDAFGQHYATFERMDTECDLSEPLVQARKYYANIVQPYGMQTAKALAACAQLIRLVTGRLAAPVLLALVALQVVCSGVIVPSFFTSGPFAVLGAVLPANVLAGALRTLVGGDATGVVGAAAYLAVLALVALALSAAVAQGGRTLRRTPRAA